MFTVYIRFDLEYPLHMLNMLKQAVANFS